jgi:hypothetical protein
MTTLLLITALVIPTKTLVLRTGDRIAVDSVKIEGAQVTFRSGGALFTIPTIEVDLDASRAGEVPVTPVRAEVRGKLRVSPEERDRLLRELEENHSGTPTPQRALDVLPYPSVYEQQQMASDEWSWRHQARSYEEDVRRRQEDLDLLQTRAEALKAHIAGLLSLGYKPNQFTYDTTQLARTVEQIPQAQLEVDRAQRSYDQFRDDARKQGVTPGWLR